MHSDLQSSLDQLHIATEEWLALTRGLSEEQANWRPAPERWSIAQCLDHVNVTTGKLLAPLQQSIDLARAGGTGATGPFRYGFVSRWFLKALEPTAAKRLSAPSAYRPAKSNLDLAAVITEFQRVQREFAQAIAAADGLDLAHIRVPSPAFALLRLPIGIWFLSTASHTHRHLNQARRVRTDQRFPV